MKKLLALILTAMMLLSLVACDKEDPASTGTTASPTGDAAIPTAPLPAFTEVENPVTAFSLSYGKTAEETVYISVNPNEDGTAHLEYEGSQSKTEDYSSILFHGIAGELAKTGLSALNGQATIEEGTASGSMEIQYKDGTMLSASYQGTVPEAFVGGFTDMDAFFSTIIANLPEHSQEQ